MIIWNLTGKIIRTVLCCAVYYNCAQWYTHPHEQFLQTTEHWFRFNFCMFLHLFFNYGQFFVKIIFVFLYFFWVFSVGYHEFSCQYHCNQLVSEKTCYVSSRMLNSIHSLTTGTSDGSLVSREHFHCLRTYCLGFEAYSSYTFYYGCQTQPYTVSGEK